MRASGRKESNLKSEIVCIAPSGIAGCWVAQEITRLLGPDTESARGQPHSPWMLSPGTSAARNLVTDFTEIGTENGLVMPVSYIAPQ